MKMTNDTYCVTLNGNRTTERYYRDRHGWVKVSSRARAFRMSAEQVLNHLLPALAFSERLGLSVTVEHTEMPYWQTRAHEQTRPVRHGRRGQPKLQSKRGRAQASTTSHRIASRTGPSGSP